MSLSFSQLKVSPLNLSILVSIRLGSNRATSAVGHGRNESVINEIKQLSPSDYGDVLPIASRRDDKRTVLKLARHF